MTEVSRTNLHGIILASGSGRRHKVLTNYTYNARALPKALLPVGNRTLIDFSIEALRGLGLSTIYVGAGPQSTAEILKDQLTRPAIYELEICVKKEKVLLDTAGTVSYILKDFIHPDPNDTVCVLPCDTPHNIDLNPISQAHLSSQAAVTIAVLPIRWSSPGWKERTFATIEVGGMPQVGRYSDRNKFEDAVGSFAQERTGKALPVTGFYEKETSDQARSNLISTGIYFFRAGFLIDLASFITPMDAEYPVSDFGLHIFPRLGGGSGEPDHQRFSPDFISKMSKGEYPFYAYLLPNNIYWRDVGNPLALLRVNMDVLDSVLPALLKADRFWHKEAWGWAGNFGASIHPGAKVIPPHPGTIGSIIGSNVVIAKEAYIERSIVLDYARVRGRVVNTVVFPGESFKKIVIDEGVSVINSIIAGGSLAYNTAPTLVEGLIVYPPVSGGLANEPI